MHLTWFKSTHFALKFFTKYFWLQIEKLTFFFFFLASQHSGTVDDEREDVEEDDTETRCCVCDQPFSDLDKWVLNASVSFRTE